MKNANINIAQTLLAVTVSYLLTPKIVNINRGDFYLPKHKHKQENQLLAGHEGLGKSAEGAHHQSDQVTRRFSPPPAVSVPFTLRDRIGMGEGQDLSPG